MMVFRSHPMILILNLKLKEFPSKRKRKRKNSEKQKRKNSEKQKRKTSKKYKNEEDPQTTTHTYQNLKRKSRSITVSSHKKMQQKLK